MVDFYVLWGGAELLDTVGSWGYYGGLEALQQARVHMQGAGGHCGMLGAQWTSVGDWVVLWRLGGTVGGQQVVEGLGGRRSQAFSLLYIQSPEATSFFCLTSQFARVITYSAVLVVLLCT